MVNPIAVDIFAFLIDFKLAVGPQTLRWFRLKDLYIDERVGASCRIFGQPKWGLIVGFLLLLYSVVCFVESLSLFYLPFIS